jgi:hypothetical protein
VFSNPERGSVLIADVLLGCVIVAILASAAAAAGIVIDAGQSSREAARDGAVAIARGWEPTGVLGRIEHIARPDSQVEVEVGGGRVRVTVSAEVTLPHPVARRLRETIVATSSVPIAPYRSRRDG